MVEEVPFGRVARARRRALDLTQEELAGRVGCAAITIRKIEAGDLRPSQQVAGRLAVALGIPAAEQGDFVRAARAVRQEQRTTPSPPPVPPAIAEAIGNALSQSVSRNYRLEEQIGAGSFGIVYRAFQPRLDRTVAIKVIRPQYADHPDFIRRFEAEAQMVARLEHPHIVPLYDYWREPGGAYLVLRYMRGGSLLTMLEHGPPPLPVTLRIIEQVGAALQAAHRAAVIHRDLKPANVLLDDECNAYLADFGIAKDLARSDAALTLAGTFIGSPAYSAPEQIRAEAITPQTDIYALGMLLYELLTGKRPFPGPTSTDYIQQHLTIETPHLATQRADLPPALDRIVQQATAKAVTARYTEVSHLVAELHHALDSRSVRAAPAAAQQATPPTVVLDLTAQDNPYKGLQPFGEADAATFFGRESLVQQLLARMAEHGELARFLAIAGPSGSGKSSAVRAGLLPALRRGELPGSAQWYIVSMVPGAEPFAELAAALHRVAPAGVEADDLQVLLRADSQGLLRAARRVLPAAADVELVLFIDQFEELWTLCADEATRVQLFDTIITATLDERSRLRVVLTIRADFVDRPLQYVDFGEVFSQRSQLVLPLTADELERAVVGPARWAGLVLEDGLTAAIVAEIGSQPGTLPLLQHALSELYTQRQGRVLTRAAYTAIGGVAGALTRSAEALFISLDPAGQETARRVLLALVNPGEGTEDTRRRVRQADLRPGGSPTAIVQVLDAFSRARLLTFDRDPQTREPTVEVAHEALLRSWPRLQQWVDASREQLRLQRRLGIAATEWVAAGRDAGFLASGGRLTQFEPLATSPEVWLSDQERAYLEASLRERERQSLHERDRQQRELSLARRGVSRLRWLVGTLAIFLLAALILSSFAYTQQQAAIANAQVAQGQALAAAAQAAIAEGDLDQARTLALAAVQAPRPASEAQAILSQAAYAPGTRRLFSGHSDAVMNVAWSPDGQLTLSGSSDNTLRLWDTATGQEIRRLSGFSANLWSVAWSPDGRFVLAGTPDRLAYMWDAATGQLIRTFQGHTDEVTKVAWSPDGRFVLTASKDSTMRLWDAATGREVRRFTGHADAVWGVAFSPDGRTIASGSDDATLRLWDAATGQELRRFTGHTSRVQSVAWSPDGRSLLSGSWDETARLWDVATGAELQRFESRGGSVWSVAWSSDGSTVASTSGNSVYVWDPASGKEEQRFSEHRDEVFSIAWSPDGRGILSGSRDGTARLWDLHNGAEERRFAGHTSSIRSVAWSPDGRTVVSGAWDWTLGLWDVASGNQLHELEGHTDGVEAVALSPDGKLIVSGSDDTTLRLWDAASGRELRSFAGHTAFVWDVAWSPDGQRVLSGSADGTLRLWDVATGRELQGFVGHTAGVESVAWSPDGQRVLSGSADTSVRVWDAATGKELQRLVGHSGAVSSVAWSPDGQTVLSGAADGTARLWNLRRGEDLHRFRKQSGPVTFVAFSPDGRTALFSAGLAALAIWDVATGEELRRFEVGGLLAYSAAFSPDGKAIVAGATDGTLWLWRIDALPELLAWMQRQRYIPQLSCAQRERYQLLPLCATGAEVP